MTENHQDIINFIRSIFKTNEFIALHEPQFFGNEKKYLNDCIDSTFVSSVGQYVDLFEKMVAEYTRSKHAIATVNGTAALHTSLILAGVKADDEVITQPLSFVATCNAINYCGARPVFVDVDKDTFGLSPVKLEAFLKHNTLQKNEGCYNKSTGKKIAAVVPMHTFGHPCKIDEIAAICKQHHLVLVEDAAESLGSFYKNKHTGTFGKVSAISFNGNKAITSGGGGMILTDDDVLAEKAKHLTTTAKISHAYEYKHDEIAYNYRLPNINAALGCAQMESLPNILKKKRELADRYKHFFCENGVTFFAEATDSISNYWLNAIILSDKVECSTFLKTSNDAGVMTRPVWCLLNKLVMFKDAQCGDLSNALWLEERIVNIPSSAKF